MKEFDLLRYVKRFRVLILLFVLLGTCGTAVYTNQRQQYIATMMVACSGEDVSVSTAEMSSPVVLAQAGTLLGNEAGLQNLRTHIRVTPMEAQAITTDDKTVYQVRLWVDGAYGAEDACNALDAIVQAYCMQMDFVQEVPPTPSDGLLDSDDEYVQIVSILRQDVEDMLAYLHAMDVQYPQFRSTQTGYCYADLYDVYQQLAQITLPQVYTQVLSGPVTRFGNATAGMLESQIKAIERQQEVNTQRREKLAALLELYAQKAEIISEAKQEDVTTYEALLEELLALDMRMGMQSLEKTELQALQNVFLTAEATDATANVSIETSILQLETTLQENAELVRRCTEDLHQVVSAEKIQIVSSVLVASTVNVPMYVVMALVLSLILGIAGAVLLGRGMEIAAYNRNIDKKTNLPNAKWLDAYITVHAKTCLPENFTCFVISLDNWMELTHQLGTVVADGVLRDFSDLVRLMGDEKDVVVYNGMGQYTVFFEACSACRAEAMAKVLRAQGAQYNRLNPESPMHFRMAHVTSGAETTYDLRALMRLAQSRLQEDADSIC